MEARRQIESKEAEIRKCGNTDRLDTWRQEVQ